MQAITPLIRSVSDSDSVSTLVLESGAQQLLWGVQAGLNADSTPKPCQMLEHLPVTGMAKHVIHSGEVANVSDEVGGELHTIMGDSTKHMMLVRLSAAGLEESTEVSEKRGVVRNSSDDHEMLIESM